MEVTQRARGVPHSRHNYMNELDKTKPIGRVLGLDVGSKTIGLALSDELAVAAYPLEKLMRRGTQADVEAVLQRARDAGVARIVVGLPLSLDGLVGPRARRVMVLVDALKTKLGDSLEVVTWDERFSTVAVERVLVDADLSRARRREVVDKQAAAYILQGYLDSVRPKDPSDP